jgi:iron complex outermembrane receptor protein
LKSDLKEIGIKADLIDNKIHLTAALYEINQENILMNANDPANPDLLVTRGAERSRGFELDVAGYILPNWQINASYSYIDAKILEDQNPDLVGARKQNTPVNSSNVWTRYNFESSILGDLGIGLGVQYSGTMVPWFVRDFTIPSFVVFDAAIYYSPDKSNFQIALNVNNLSDKTYWIGAQNYLRLFPGAPRNAMLTATYKF